MIFLCFSPIGRAVEAVRHLANHSASGVLILPVWPMSVWFNYFFPDGKHVVSWVKRLVFIDPIFSSGRRVGVVSKGIKHFLTVALEFDFKQFALLQTESMTLPDFCLKKGCARCT